MMQWHNRGTKRTGIHTQPALLKLWQGNAAKIEFLKSSFYLFYQTAHQHFRQTAIND